MKNDFPQSLSTTRSSERPCNFCKPLLFSSSLFSYAWRCCLTRHSTMCQSTSGEMCSRHWGLTRFRGDEQAYGTSWHGLPGTPRPGKNYSEAGSPGLSLIYADSFIGSSTFIQPEPLNQSKVSLIFTWREEKWELCWGKLQREATPLHPFLVDFLQNRIHPFFPITGLFPVFLWIHWYAERASLVGNYRAHSISFYLTLSWIISFLKEKGWVRRCLEFFFSCWDEMLWPKAIWRRKGLFPFTVPSKAHHDRDIMTVKAWSCGVSPAVGNREQCVHACYSLPFSTYIVQDPSGNGASLSGWVCPPRCNQDNLPWACSEAYLPSGPKACQGDS